ncbi:hypothetical protein BKA70DRAFT_1281037 [Coprinopsis sp. MPI-PUGE-AT-0042]|nr:hypothetical protein BKA70DRAFT_1281037 [Coprinopsis sp. MPI-PUGE-AT-0042]
MKHKKRPTRSSAGSEQPAAAHVNQLATAISSDILPTDDTTNELWGFNRATESPEGHLGPSCLLDLYQSLVKHQGIDLQKLDQWRRQGILLPQTKKVFEAIPAETRGSYYPWLLRNEYVLDRSQSIPSISRDELVPKVFRSGWNYATNNHPASEDTMRDTVASWPPRKQKCMYLCAMLLHSYNPPPDLDMWLQFGLCVGDRHSQMEIVEIYKKLINSTSFNEFYHAYENAQLVDLFNRKGLTQSAAFRRVTDEFEDVVGGWARGILKSAWHLKAFVQGPNPIRPGDMLGVYGPTHADYGWINCKNVQDLKQLLRAYQRYFNSPGASCSELHSACINGRLADKECKGLLKNHCPLPAREGDFDASQYSGLVYFNPNPPIIVRAPSSTPFCSYPLFGIAVAILGASSVILFNHFMR